MPPGCQGQSAEKEPGNLRVPNPIDWIKYTQIYEILDVGDRRHSGAKRYPEGQHRIVGSRGDPGPDVR